MKKSLLALAVLGAFAGVASAQSSVTLYGLIDVNFGKDIGKADKRMSQGASSRLGFRGVEDLGSGSAAFFQLENRYTPNNGLLNGGAGGTNGTPVTLWQGRSYVGLRGGWGEVRLGREYNGAFFHGELMGDPWGWDTVASSLTVAAMRAGDPTFTNVNNSVTYNSPNMSGFSFTGQVAESNANCGSPVLASSGVTFGACAKRPYSGGASYAAGPFAVRIGYAAPGTDGQKWTSLNSQYDFGAFKLWGFIGSGTTPVLLNAGGNAQLANATAPARSYMLAVSAPMGQAELRAAVVDVKVNDVKTVQGFALGYHYALSKRTTVYADFAQNRKAILASSVTGAGVVGTQGEKSAYDFGVKHAF